MDARLVAVMQHANRHPFVAHLISHCSHGNPVPAGTRPPVSTFECPCLPVCRLSLSWTRIIPGGIKGSPVNTEGVNLYKSLLAGLKSAGIEPLVTLFHWDLPQVLQVKSNIMVCRSYCSLHAGCWQCCTNDEKLQHCPASSGLQAMNCSL